MNKGKAYAFPLFWLLAEKLTFYLKGNGQLELRLYAFASDLSGLPGRHITDDAQGFLVQTITHISGIQYLGFYNMALFVDDKADVYRAGDMVIDGVWRVFDVVIDVLVQGLLTAGKLWLYLRSAIDLWRRNG